MNRYRVYFRVGSKTYWRVIDAPNAAEAKLTLERSFWVVKAERPIEQSNGEIARTVDELRNRLSPISEG